MDIKVINKSEFIELEVDEIKATVWKDDLGRIEKIIDNLFDVIEDFTERTEVKTIEEFLKDRGYGH